MVDLRTIIDDGFFKKEFSYKGEIFTVTIGKKNYLDRKRTENFIQEIFFKSYSAKVQITYPFLISIANKDGQIVAALGIRSAGSEKLFLEKYLDKKLTKYFSIFSKKKIIRKEIAEVGNLAAKDFGALKYLIKFCVNSLAESGHKYISLTGIKSLYTYFALLGLKPTIIADADPARVRNPELWGSYYKSNPKVVIGDISAIHDKIGTNLDVQIAVRKTIAKPKFRSLHE